MFALRALRALGLAPAVTPVVFVNSDEEIGSSSSEPVLRQIGKGADRAFVLEAVEGKEGLSPLRRSG